ncbi:MAG: 50S ribosome-binding GTPase [Planctomycetaceae bacterium]|nr:50S ribosome-binding GTPase [Planctomycetaceae bacterium]
MKNDGGTIIAQASAHGSGVRGILRISGADAVKCVKKIIRCPELISVTKMPVIIVTEIILPDFPPFPAKLFCWADGHSYTGGETIEIHTAGSPVLLNKITAVIVNNAAADGSYVRLAEPGEFTMRAFLSGRLDLTQAEAVLGVIEAANDADLKTALNQLAGNVAAPLSGVWSMLFNLLTEIEAGLDFADEDITFVEPGAVRSVITEALQHIENLQRQMQCRAAGSEKPRVVLAGLPNAGKSTLFNKLLGRDAAIVSPLAGTTRDYLEGETTFGGIDCVLIDTAGQESQQLPENTDAGVIIYCYENNPLPPSGGNVIRYQTKRADESIDVLRQQIGAFLCRTEQAAVLRNTALRCTEAVIFAAESLRRALELTDESLIALELRRAVNHLGLINGTVHTEDILDRIFSRFCIGK